MKIGKINNKFVPYQVREKVNNQKNLHRVGRIKIFDEHCNELLVTDIKLNTYRRKIDGIVETDDRYEIEIHLDIDHLGDRAMP